MGLIELVYVSYATVPMTNEELITLLGECKENNQKINVTGMLLYRDRYFIQALEGEEQVVRTLFQKISQDTRHGNVITVSQRPIQERSFGDWTMGFKNLDQVDASQYQGLTDFLTQPVSATYFQDHPSHAKDLLLTFRSEIYY